MRPYQIMKNILIAAFLFVGTLTAQSDSAQKNIKNLDIEPTYHGNEIAIANFFPMIFQQTWGNNYGAIYKYNFQKKQIALRVQLFGNFDKTSKFVVDNNDYVNPIPDEFNLLNSKYNSWNLGLGVQHTMIGHRNSDLSVYHFIDFFMGGSTYNQKNSNGVAYVNGTGGKNITYFNIYETNQSMGSMFLNFGLGLNYHVYKNVHIQLETKLAGNISNTEYSNTSRVISYDIQSNKYYESSKSENKNPKVNNTGLDLTPATSLYFSYRF